MSRTYRWTIIPRPDDGRAEQMAKEINIPESLSRVLLNRGIDTYAKAKEFFRPQHSDLNDPFLMDGMEKAVDRFDRALTNHEKIMVFGDYDVDGTNSASMLVLFFRDMGAETAFHIPDRVKEGYGISKPGIDIAKQEGVTLLVAVDCGITAVEQVEYAKSLGIDVIICDHHEPGGSIPDGVAVLDPIKPHCSYPFKHLCGCGVGFKFIQAICKRHNIDEKAFEYVDFVTLATTADIVPLVGENRILTKIGLEKINSTPRPGIRALIESSGAQFGKISTGQIVFILAPRINAVGRMGDASRAVSLLVSDDEFTAQSIAQVLEEENRARRRIDEETFLKAQELVEDVLNVDNDPAIVLHHEAWHPGVIGIVASRLVEKYYRPTIMMTTVEGVAKGSARSIVGFDIHSALKRVEDKLIQFGGHKYAAGLAVELDRVDEFREAFNLVVNELMPEEIRTPEIRIDTEITFADLNARFLRILKEFAPFGPGNMRPIFLAKHVEAVGTPKLVGNNHLRLKLRQDRQIFDAIGFGLGDLLETVKNSSKNLDVVFSVDEHEWQSPSKASGQRETFPQLKIKDIKVSSEG